MTNPIEAEIIKLHQFFQAWFKGALPNTPAAFSRMERVMGEGFKLIGPDGHMAERASLLHGLFQAHGGHPQMRIWIEQVQVQQRIGPITLATYEEWQEVDQQVTRRISTVLFQSRANTPNGVEWLHVHETWLE